MPKMCVSRWLDVEAGPHTRLINMFMGLCMNTVGWPNILGELGYKVRLIEQTLSLQSAKKVVPDVVAVSDKTVHAIVAECKFGEIKADQDQRYQQLASEDLISHIAIHDRNRLSHTVCYVDMPDNHDRREPNTGFPFITFGRDYITVSGDLGHKELRKCFAKPIPLKGYEEPGYLYPFSHDDEDYVVIPHVLHGLIACAWKPPSKRLKIDDPGTPAAILAIVHRHVELISAKHKNQLKSRIKNVINELLKERSDLRELVSKIDADEHRTASIQRLQKICEGVINDYETQTRLDRF